jgi:hypothetical protein
MIRYRLTLPCDHARRPGCACVCVSVCRVVSSCLALVTAGALEISDEAVRGRDAALDQLHEAIGRLPFPHVRPGHPLIALVLPPLVHGERLLPCTTAEDTGAATVVVHLCSRLPRTVRLDRVALVVDRATVGAAAAAAAAAASASGRGTPHDTLEAFEAENVELAARAVTTVRLTYKARVCE